MSKAISDVSAAAQGKGRKPRQVIATLSFSSRLRAVWHAFPWPGSLARDQPTQGSHRKPQTSRTLGLPAEPMARRAWAALALLAALVLSAPAASCAASIRGLGPALAQRYQPVDGKFACLDGLKTIPFEQVLSAVDGWRSAELQAALHSGAGRPRRRGSHSLSVPALHVMITIAGQ